MTKQSIRKEYNAFCDKAQVPVFARDWFLDTACVGGSWDVVFEEKKGEVIGVMPYFRKKKYGFTYIAMPAFVRYMGPFLLPQYQNLKDQHRIYKNLIACLPKVDSFNQNFEPEVTNWLPFFWENYRQSTRYTYRLDISDTEAVFKGFALDIRRNIKKAKNQVEITDSGTSEEFYAVHKMTFDRQGKAMPYSMGTFKNHIKALEERGLAKMFFARDEQARIHAVSCLMRDGDMAYYHISGGDPALRKSGAGILLVWHIICYAREVWGVKTFDFEGSMIKNVEQVWHRAGAYQVPYFNIRKNNSKVFSLVEQVRRG
jgi:lipid II:glycine glycyltransferase (peptidoglycan interpeptide bridge formation enzyme)